MLCNGHLRDFYDSLPQTHSVIMTVGIPTYSGRDKDTHTAQPNTSFQRWISPSYQLCRNTETVENTHGSEHNIGCPLFDKRKTTLQHDGHFLPMRYIRMKYHNKNLFAHMIPSGESPS